MIDATPYFCEEHRRQQHAERRIGFLGTLGLAELLIRLHIRYGSPECLTFLDTLDGFIATEAYLASTHLAAEKGVFPCFEADAVLQSGFLQTMPDAIRQAIRAQGLRERDAAHPSPDRNGRHISEYVRRGLNRSMAGASSGRDGSASMPSRSPSMTSGTPRTPGSACPTIL